MILSIMQPYLFPYMGYWQLIANTDKFIFFDVVQYNKKSWMNRNRVLHPDKNKEFQYIAVPTLKHDKGTLIKDILLNNEEDWKNRILGQLTVYKKLKAPYYIETLELINEIFNFEYNTLLSLSIESTKVICKYLSVPFDYKIASSINFNRDEIKAPGDWALSISKQLKANKYLNPHGGYEIFDADKYKKNGITIEFIKSKLSPYKQSWRENFEPGLSIIDVLMFIEKKKIKELLLSDYNIFDKKQLQLLLD